jgi:hypothetical protein
MTSDKKVLYTREDLRRAVGRVVAEEAELVYTRDDVRETAAEMGLSPDHVEAAALVARGTRGVRSPAIESRARLVCKVGLAAALLVDILVFCWPMVFAGALPGTVPLKVFGTLGVVLFALGFSIAD